MDVDKWVNIVRNRCDFFMRKDIEDMDCFEGVSSLLLEAFEYSCFKYVLDVFGEFGVFCFGFFGCI